MKGYLRKHSLRPSARGRQCCLSAMMINSVEGSKQRKLWRQSNKIRLDSTISSNLPYDIRIRHQYLLSIKSSVVIGCMNDLRSSSFKLLLSLCPGLFMLVLLLDNLLFCVLEFASTASGLKPSDFFMSRGFSHLSQCASSKQELQNSIEQMEKKKTYMKYSN